MVNQEVGDSTLRRRPPVRGRSNRIPTAFENRGTGANDGASPWAAPTSRVKSGPFQVVTAEYQYFQNGALCVREERDIVYLQGPVPAQPLQGMASRRKRCHRLVAITFDPRSGHAHAFLAH